MQKFRKRSNGIFDILFSKSPTIFDEEAWRKGELDRNGQNGRFGPRRACEIESGALVIGQRHGRMSSQQSCAHPT